MEQILKSTRFWTYIWGQAQEPDEYKSTIKFEIKKCYGYEDSKKKAIRDSQASTFSKFLTVDIMLIQQFVFHCNSI